jgi:hypothetical protein
MATTPPNSPVRRSSPPPAPDRRSRSRTHRNGNPFVEIPFWRQSANIDDIIGTSSPLIHNTTRRGLIQSDLNPIPFKEVTTGMTLYLSYMGQYYQCKVVNKNKEAITVESSEPN